MGAIYRTSGDTIPFTPEENVEAGQFVAIGDTVGITKFPVHAGKKGTIATVGIFDNVPKYDVSCALTNGQIVYLNPENGKIYNATSAGYIPCGYAVDDADATANVCKIFLTPTTCESTATVTHTYVGQTISHTPTDTVTAGSLMAIGSLVGYAATSISAGEAGTVQVSGVVEQVAKHNASNALTNGQIVYLNPVNGKIYNATSAGYIPCGYAIGTATATSTKCKVLLWPGLQDAAS